jgi:hypothetical protein
LEEKYMNFLKEEGYKPKIIEGYGIVFQYKGDNYSLEFDKTQNNHQIFTLGAGFPYDFKTDVDKIEAQALANYVNKAGRIGKIWIDPEARPIPPTKATGYGTPYFPPVKHRPQIPTISASHFTPNGEKT